MLKKAVIIAAGSCGLLLADYLLNRGNQYQVKIYERRRDPRLASYGDSRTFPIVISERGYKALSQIPEPEEAVKATSMVIHRNDLVKVLLKQAISKYSTPKLSINFNYKCDGLVAPPKENSWNLAKKTIKFHNLKTETNINIDCDLLIGADGARSIVREIFANLSDSFEYSQEYIPTAYKSIFIPPDGKNHRNRYHLGENCLLIGDAAHALSPALGQGCNSGLEDVFILNNLLDEYSDNWSEAIEQFTIRRKADADAVVELSSYATPMSSRLFIKFDIKQNIQKFLYKLFPRYFFPGLFESLSQPNIRYAEILEFYRGWVSKVKKSNEKLLAQF
jgi:2-polyprenyl-6-methoxyphenol hydroxylase-like FAD-dependent oxidoreductase